MINEFSKVAGSKINTQKLVAFCIPIMNYQKGKLRKQSHSQLLQKIKYLGINLTKDIRGLYLENYKTLKKEIEEDMNK